jgi:hypothetical protein
MTGKDLVTAPCWFVVVLAIAFIAYTFGAHLLGR